MSVITPSKEQSKRSAADIFVAFEYQWDYFVLMLLKENDDDATVSFELRDDVDTQTEEGITLYQIKHSVRKSSKGETINLSNRDTDLWKTISIWMKYIDDEPDILENTKFQLITNKAISKNKFVEAIEAFHNTHSVEDLKSAIVTIKESERTEKSKIKSDNSVTNHLNVAQIITDLLNKTYLNEFCSRIYILKTSDVLEEDIKRIMSNRFGLNHNRIDWVYDQLMTKLRNDSIDNIKSGKSVTYNGAVFKERYQSILDIGRRKIYFKDCSINDFEGNFRELLFMKQLFSVYYVKENEVDRMSRLTLSWLRFNNNFHELCNDNILINEDVNNLTKDVLSAWDNCYNKKYRKITEMSTDDELSEAGCCTIDDMREKLFSLAETPLGNQLSEGCIYYYSNSATEIIPDLPLIGWHRDWKNKFKK
ncbi:hypothetical protein PG_0834 [Porphyromonas gingivalis W83]|uniref:Uncharacterized protein n=1 Tax=Porphyromonas gingivalis (strain ATCC BAA-308 / W83) TaxID=242619 RepID=Q7MW26_PORGI|nr:dsDNA nuclease domain-containing protein [Porphyromonas gingivalis]AAQ65987.1 hypothetical protein PG_0834 [Porphyromonas gingivalis W83]ATR98032.1 DUF4297 domain-containing protein [Porphyromonas gingivalis]ATR98307.1 DUF4297 domain-containing protein [Porphyromonas gingivalis]AUR45994.1 hypothetical protein CF003_0834 [Porphyromonas gingivalis]EIW92840.1 hypothetical protein HMPREF1322_1064 [Porphyromonas gingivalis W50]